MRAVFFCMTLVGDRVGRCSGVPKLQPATRLHRHGNHALPGNLSGSEVSCFAPRTTGEGRDVHRIPGTTISTVVCLAYLAAAMSLAGCRSTPPHAEPIVLDASPASPEKPTASRGEFTVPASTLDTWNAVGQVLVRLHGVTYEGRAQMLGLYAVQYRGERFLILTRGLVVTHERQTLATEVSARLLDGKPHGSDAAVELLGLLQRRLPGEIARITAGKK